MEIAKKAKLKGSEMSQILSKINEKLKELQADVQLIEQLQVTADGLKTTCSNKLQSIIDIANRYKKRVEEKIDDAFEEINKLESV